MNRDQAAEIAEYLLEAACELDEARAAISLLAEGNRENGDASLEAAVIKLNSELLDLIFDRFPDLMPFEEFPKINSKLRWDQVRLPPSVSEAEVDQIIFAVTVPQWRKMARIVGDAFVRCKEVGLSISDEVLAARIQAFVEADDRLEGQGDLRKWRHSEVRLKG
jgi:hypothetical protein